MSIIYNTYSIMNNHVKIYVDFERFTERNNWQVKVQRDCTVCQLQYKLRKFAKLEESEGVFLFFVYYGFLGNKKERLYSGNKMLGEIKEELGQDTLHIKMMVDNAFGAFSKMFIKAKIQERKGLYVSSITYSYFGLYHFDEVKVHDSLTEATEHLLRERCSGYLTLESNEKKE